MADPANGWAGETFRPKHRRLTAFALVLIIGATLAPTRLRAGPAPKAGAEEAISPATTPPAQLDAESLLEKLKAMDARFEAGFTAAGTRVWVPPPVDPLITPPPQKMKWKISMADGRIAYEEEAIEVLSWKDALGPGEEPPPANRRAPLMHLRKTMLTGPKYYAVYFLTGITPPPGPLAPWPEGETGPASSGMLSIRRPDDPANLGQIDRSMQLIGRWYSVDIDRITSVSVRNDGLVSFAAEGTKYKGERWAIHQKWELVVDPKAAYMMRSAKIDVVGVGKEHEKWVFTGLRRHGGLCVPETAQPQNKRFPHTINSFSSKPDLEFFKRAQTGTHGPFLVRTDFMDHRIERKSFPIETFARQEFKPGESWTDE